MLMNRRIRLVAFFLSSLTLPLWGCGPGDSGGTGGGGGGGPEVTELKFTGGPPAKPRFSPDDTLIAYVQSADAGEELGVMTVAGEDRKNLGPAGGYLSAPAWSPDGETLYFTSDDGIKSIPAAGGTAEVVVTEFATTDPDVSADGTRLVFAQNGGPLRLVDLATPDMPQDLGTSGFSPRFSPDGKKIVYQSGFDLKIMDLASGDVTDVLDTGNYLASADWLPEGDRLAAITDDGIEILTLGEGAPERELISDQFAAKDIDVSADGKSIVYAVNGQSSIFVLTGF
ncbi:MAG: hypothetical protein R3B70_20580 [Polyangiaceae bacterium]